MHHHVSLAKPDELGQIGISQMEYPMDQVQAGRIWCRLDHGLSVGDLVQVDRYHATVSSIGTPKQVRVILGGGATNHEPAKAVPVYLSDVQWI
jgi:hypothetical protein